MFNEDKISLTEATVLALQGKLKLEETRPARKRNNRLKKVESVNVTTDDVTVSTDENGNTTVETDKEIVTVSQKTTETDLPLIDEPIEDNEGTIDVPVDGDETIIPEEEVSEETVEDIIDEPEEDDEDNEDNDQEIESIENLEIDESKKIQENKKPLNEWIQDDYDLKLFLAYELRNKVPAFEDKIDVNNFEDNEIVNEVYNRLKDTIDYELDQILYDLFPKEMGLDESKKLESKSLKKESNKIKTESATEMSIFIYNHDEIENMIAEMVNSGMYDSELDIRTQEAKDELIQETVKGINKIISTQEIEKDNNDLYHFRT